MKEMKKKSNKEIKKSRTSLHKHLNEVHGCALCNVIKIIKVAEIMELLN